MPTNDGIKTDGGPSLSESIRQAGEQAAGDADRDALAGRVRFLEGALAESTKQLEIATKKSDELQARFETKYRSLEERISDLEQG